MAKRGISGWLADQSIQRKLFLAFGLILAVFALAVAAILGALANQAEAQRWTRHTRSVIQEITAATRAANDADLALRGFLMSGDRRALAGYRSDLAAVERHLDKARTLTADAPEQQLVLQRAREHMVRWTEKAAEPAIAELTPLIGTAGFAQASFDIGAHYLQDSATTFGNVDSALDSAIDSEQAKLQRRSAALDRAVVLLRMLVVGMLGLGILIGIVALVGASRSLTAPIRHLTDLMTGLAGGDHAIDVPGQRRRDEIGAIARALQVFKDAALATGTRNWVKTHVGEIAAVLQGTDRRDEFARALTSELAPLVKAGIAVFYIADDSERELELLGSYGFRQRKHLATRYAVGEGLVGQVAFERKPILLEQVPDDYVRIHSGVGEAPPRNIIALPLMLQDRLLGVLEFGSFTPFGAAEQQLLDELLPFAALSLENLNRALRTQQLLDHTRQQAKELQVSEEELRVQQEELAATNEELHGKTAELEEQQQRLRSSEEELQVQAEELQASNEELRQKSETLVEQKAALEVLQRETEAKAQELAKASQYKSDFLANMSHELRTPLNSLLILSRNLADNDSGNLDHGQMESARVIHESGTNLLRLINDILDLAKIEAGKMHATPEDLQVRYFTQSLVRRFQPVASEKLLDFALDVAEDLPDVFFTDGPRLEQIANNLIGNALKFTREGKVRVDFARPSPQLAKRVGLAAEHAIAIAVHDTGIGIPADKIEHIFGTFEQMDAGTSRKYGGSGLGLAISQRLAELLGGRIFVDSTPGEGSCFTVVLPEHMQPGHPVEDVEDTEAPAAPPELEPLRDEPRPAAPGSMPKPWIPDDRDNLHEGDTTILSIEDDPVFARTLVEMIRRKGHRALAAGDGESGIYLARQFRPNGILLDVRLPGIDGWGVFDRLKQDRNTASIPVHFISAVDEAARAQQLGAVGFLTKPVERDAVLTAFDRLLRASDGEQRKVLLIDDDPDSRVAISTLIRADNVEIVEASSAESGLQYLDSYTFDCIVLDIGLPGMSGIDFLDVIAARGPLPPIVIHSGHELSREESAKLRQYTDSIVVKGTRSLERLLDEVSLFLHSVRRNGQPNVVRDIDSCISGRTVLIVDDDMRNIFALSKILREKGLNVVMAQDGQKALRQIEENQAIEIVLMDIMMPGMDGYQTMREIRKNPAHAKLPMIAVTAKAMSGDRDKCLAAGANDYLAKPIDIDKLLSIMRTWLHA